MIHEIRLLEPADVPAYREIRLEGLRLHPCAFAASLPEEAARSPAEFAARLGLEHHPVFGALVGGELCGIAGLSVEEYEKKRHKGTLRGVYVRPYIRREGVGSALVSHVIEAARSRVTQVHAAVVTTNQPARTLYRKLGFAPYGLEPRGLLVDGRFYDQELLVLVLK